MRIEPDLLVKDGALNIILKDMENSNCDHHAVASITHIQIHDAAAERDPRVWLGIKKHTPLCF